MKLKRKNSIMIMINVLLLKNLIRKRHKILLQDQNKQIYQAKMVLLIS